VPCYIDQLYPNVAWASLELLEAHGADVDVPAGQTCCGQPLSNLGAGAAARPLGERFAGTFAGYEFVVCPSGSCTAMLQRFVGHDGSLRGHALDAGHVRAPRVFELCEFLVDVLGVEQVEATFPHPVALHQSCHALRELGLGTPSELGGGSVPRDNPGRKLLSAMKGLTLVEPARPDECCGFGGSFCMTEPALSSRIGEDRVLDFERAGARVVTSLDVSCLMHLSGVSRRQQRPLDFMHIAEVLRGRALPRPESEGRG
jgi:L-lactate dehydrogenase complex protein LldE